MEPWALVDVESFVEVMRAGTLTAAAERLGVTQPALSGRIRRLERHLGATLFERSRGGMRPTADAVVMMANVAGHIDGLRAVAGGAHATATGRVRLGGPADIVAARIVPAVAPLVAAGLDVAITTGLAGDLLAGLADGELDLVVSGIRGTARGLVHVPLVDEEFVLVGGPAAARTIVAGRLATDPVAALGHLPLVAFAADLPIIRRYWLTEFARRAPNRVALVVPDLRAVLAAVVAGAGVSVVPRYLADPLLDSGAIELLHRPVHGPLNTVYLVTAGPPGEQPAVAALHAHLIGRAAVWGTI